MVNSIEVATVCFFRCCNNGSKRPKFTRLSRQIESDYNFCWGYTDSFLCDNILKTEPFFGRFDQSCIEMGSIFPHIGFHTVWIFYRHNLHSLSIAHLTSFLVQNLCDSSFSDRTLKSKQIVTALTEIVNLKVVYIIMQISYWLVSCRGCTTKKRDYVLSNTTFRCILTLYRGFVLQ